MVSTESGLRIRGRAVGGGFDDFELDAHRAGSASAQAAEVPSMLLARADEVIE